MNDPVNLIDPTGLITSGDLIRHGRNGLAVGVGVGLVAGLYTANPIAGFATGFATAAIFTATGVAGQYYRESMQNFDASNPTSPNNRSPASTDPTADNNNSICNP